MFAGAGGLLPALGLAGGAFGARSGAWPSGGTRRQRAHDASTVLRRSQQLLADAVSSSLVAAAAGVAVGQLSGADPLHLSLQPLPLTLLPSLKGGGAAAATGAAHGIANAGGNTLPARLWHGDKKGAEIPPDPAFVPVGTRLAVPWQQHGLQQ